MFAARATGQGGGFAATQPPAAGDHTLGGTRYTSTSSISTTPFPGSGHAQLMSATGYACRTWRPWIGRPLCSHFDFMPSRCQYCSSDAELNKRTGYIGDETRTASNTQAAIKTPRVCILVPRHTHGRLSLTGIRNTAECPD